MQTSHDAITAHRLVVLAEVYTVSQDWGNLFFKLSLAEALEEVATRVAEEAWLYNENAFYFCFYYIHDSNLNSYIRFSKTYPSFLTVKEGSTSHLGLLSSGEKKETALLGARNRYALRLADHQRSSPGCAGWDRQGTACFLSTLDCAGWEQLDSSSLQYRSALVVVRMRNIGFYSTFDRITSGEVPIRVMAEIL